MKIRKYFGAILVACMLVCAIAFVACGGDNTTDPTKASEDETPTPTGDNTQVPTEDITPSSENIKYTLKLVDYNGGTYTSLSGVLSLDGGTMIPITKGEASFEAKKGDHTATLDINSNGLYVNDTCIFTEENPNLVIPVYNRVTSTNKDFYKSDYGADYVETGATYVKLKGTKSSGYEGERSFFIFQPKRDGIYKISVISDKDVSVGCYGGSVLNVFDHTIIEPVDNAIEYSVHKSSITSDGSAVCIIGLTTDGSVDNCVIVIERVSDMPITFADLEWEVPTLTQPLYPVKLSYQNKKVTLTNLDLSDANLTLVLNSEDGYYHLGTAEGPLVYVKIAAGNDYFGMDPETDLPIMGSFVTIMDTETLCAYFSDENGNPLRKENYSEIIKKYAEMLDASGVYPLDTMIEYIIKNHGERVGWWNYESSNNLYDFYEVEKPPVENAWLFAACLVTVEDVDTNAENALLVDPTGGTSLVAAGDNIYYAVNEKANVFVTLTVKADKGISVLYDGQTFDADETGVITISVGEIKNFTIVGSEELTDAVEVSYSYEYKVEYEYTVSVKTKGGMALEKITVFIYDGNTIAGYATTDADGNAKTMLPKKNGYTAVVPTLPDGYSAEERYAFDEKNHSDVVVASSVITDGNAPSSYKLGDVMYDFTITTYNDKKEMTLSDILKEKDMVLINFWFDGCIYCLWEFPEMDEMYREFSDRVEILALAPYDNDAGISSFMNKNAASLPEGGLTFPVAHDDLGLVAKFNPEGYPTSIVVDRYGVVCLIVVGAMDKYKFEAIFEHFTGDDYEQSIIDDPSVIENFFRNTYC